MFQINNAIFDLEEIYFNRLTRSRKERKPIKLLINIFRLKHKTLHKKRKKMYIHCYIIFRKTFNNIFTNATSVVYLGSISSFIHVLFNVKDKESLFLLFIQFSFMKTNILEKGSITIIVQKHFQLILQLFTRGSLLVELFCICIISSVVQKYQ